MIQIFFIFCDCIESAELQIFFKILTSGSFTYDTLSFQMTIYLVRLNFFLAQLANSGTLDPEVSGLGQESQRLVLISV